MEPAKAQEIHVRLLGRPCLVDASGVRRGFRSHRIPALLTYLICTGGWRARAEVATALWEDKDTSQARHALRQTLVYLRESGLELSVEADRDAMRIAEHVSTDLRNLVDWAQGRRNSHPEEVEKLLNSWREGLLDGFTDRWIEEERFVINELVIQRASALQRLPDYRSIRQALRSLEPSKLLAHPDEVGSSGGPSEFFIALNALGGNEVSAEALNLFRASLPYFSLSNQMGAALDWAEAALGRLGKNDPRADRLRLDRIDLLSFGNHLAQALDEARALALSSTDQEVQAMALVKAASAAVRSMDLPAAKSLADRAIALCRTAGMAGDHLKALVSLVGTALLAGDHSQCVKLGTMTAKECRAQGAVNDEFKALSYVVQSRMALGQPWEPVYARIKDLHLASAGNSLALVDLNLSRIQEGQGKISEARTGYESGIELARKEGSQFSTAIGLTYLGELEERAGHAQVALACHQEALDIRNHIGDRLGRACSLRAMGRVWLAEGEPLGAQDNLTNAMCEFRALGDANGYVSCRLLLVLVHDLYEMTDVSFEAASALALYAKLPPGASERMGVGYDEIINQVSEFAERSLTSTI